ncbi:hypothetical protein LTR53_013092 [Teratosphaeriaceae sp. CCFEE 6253]|nr:hypothetical protein LTR53_013092 [Teratosphaeriaceae sp. CCFEE 6253]
MKFCVEVAVPGLCTVLIERLVRRDEKLSEADRPETYDAAVPAGDALPLTPVPRAQEKTERVDALSARSGNHLRFFALPRELRDKFYDTVVAADFGLTDGAASRQRFVTLVPEAGRHVVPTLVKGRVALAAVSRVFSAGILEALRRSAVPHHVHLTSTPTNRSGRSRAVADLVGLFRTMPHVSHLFVSMRSAEQSPGVDLSNALDAYVLDHFFHHLAANRNLRALVVDWAS